MPFGRHQTADIMVRFNTKVEYDEELGIYIATDEYSDFYEIDYLRNNPSMHLQDVDEKSRMIKELLSEHDLEREIESVLEIGCGTAHILMNITNYLSKSRGLPVFGVGVDISARILSLAVKDSNIVKVQANSEYLPFDNKHFSLGLCLDVVEHTKNPARLISELARTSRHTVVKIPLERSIYTVLKGGTRRLDHLREKLGHIHHFNLSSIQKLLSKDFNILAVKLEPIPRRSPVVTLMQDLLLDSGLNRTYAILFGGFAVLLCESKA